MVIDLLYSQNPAPPVPDSEDASGLKIGLIALKNSACNLQAENITDTAGHQLINNIRVDRSFPNNYMIFSGLCA